MTVNPELESLLVTCRVHHDGTPTGYEFNDPIPYLTPHPTRDVTDEYTRTDFQEPPREVSSETWRYIGEHDDGQNSSPYPTPLGTA